MDQFRRPRRVAASWFPLSLAAAAGVSLAASPQPARRAPPPAAEWDKATAGLFFDDAFAELQGPRPGFAVVPTPATTGETGPGTPGQAVPAGDGFTWSALVSGDTLTDEIKEQRERVALTVTTPSTFKGGGYQEAQKAFSMLALSFGLIAAHDEDVRWKKDATTARDLFARAGFNCKVGTDQSLKESKLRVDDLSAMLQGDPPLGKPDREEDFLWSQVSGRPPLMMRLEAAEKAIGAATSAQGEFTKELGVVVHEAEIVAAIGQVVQQSDFEDHDDESYVGYAAAMRDAAVRLRDACVKKDYAAAGAAAAAISKACTDCHGDYR